jgi:hypothetical protein
MFFFATSNEIQIYAGTKKEEIAVKTGYEKIPSSPEVAQHLILSSMS